MDRIHFIDPVVSVVSIWMKRREGPEPVKGSGRYIKYRERMPFMILRMARRKY